MKLRPAALAALLLAANAPAQAPTTVRASVSSASIEANGVSDGAAISADGRVVAFLSAATNLVALDLNGKRDVFVRDLPSGTTTRVSMSTAGAEANGDSGTDGMFLLPPALSADGRFVAFTSLASNLVPGDTNANPPFWLGADVFVHDRMFAATTRVSTSSAGVQGDRDSSRASISADGRYVVFASNAATLLPGDTNGMSDVFVKDRNTALTTRASNGLGGAQPNNRSDAPWISADGRYVAFHSLASNLVASDTNGGYDVFVYDRTTLATVRASVATGGVQANDSSADPVLSADGRHVAFSSLATNLVAGDTNVSDDVFARDLVAGTTTRVSVTSGGAQADFVSVGASISSNGRYVAFFSGATNLVAADTNGAYDDFVHDRTTATTTRASVDGAGFQVSGNAGIPSISADGRSVAFSDDAPDLVPSDANGVRDVFVRDRGGLSIQEFCAGDAAGYPCPCGNPGAPGRGCANSQTSSPGARLTGAGTTSPDTVVLDASDMLASALHIYLQGDVLLSAGVPFGDGVRCAGGQLLRLAVKSAVGGASHFPDAAAGDPSITARCAALGSPIPPGATRAYQTYYRDPSLAFCPFPAGNTWNVTNGVVIGW